MQEPANHGQLTKDLRNGSPFGEGISVPTGFIIAIAMASHLLSYNACPDRGRKVGRDDDISRITDV